MAAQAHLNAWAPNFGIQEYLVLGTTECDALFPSEHRMEDGMFHVSDAPGLGVRLTGATLFLALRLIWMSVMIYMTTQVLLVVMGIDARHSPLVAAAFGLIAITYTSMGGLRAVVINDDDNLLSVHLTDGTRHVFGESEGARVTNALGIFRWHLERQIDAHELPREAYQWYLDIRAYGSFPHAGFGMGIERCVAWICGVPHLRETSAYPRLINRLYP